MMMSNWSVVMFGLDSMSKENMKLQLPVTHELLQRLGFIDMNGHVKIGDNTFLNWIGILMSKHGRTTKDFPAEVSDAWGIYYDDWNLTWYDYSRQGFATLFAEDRPDIGTFNYFNYEFGFKHMPTDHYFRPYWLAVFWSLVHLRSSPNCYSNIPDHQLQLRYLEDFVKKYDGTRSFAWFWLQDLSHDYLNRVGVADGDFAAFFRRSMPHFDNSILVFFSDHGHRYAQIRETVNGRIEARMPYLSIRLPPKLRAKYPQLEAQLRANSAQMTTQFDLHETLVDILNGRFEGETAAHSHNHRAASLFGAVSSTRTCFEAGIPDEYCPCYKEVPIDPMKAVDAADALMRHVAALLSTEGTKCLPLHLAKIAFASVSLPPPKMVRDPQVAGRTATGGYQLHYRVMVAMKAPSQALIEAVIVKHLDTGVYTVSGDIDRNNKYANTSHCVHDRTLKKLCHCRDLVANEKTPTEQ